MAQDKKITIENGQGQRLEVFEKAYKVVYASAGYHPVSDSKGTETDERSFFDYSREELEKVKNDDLKAFLFQEAIDHDSKATKPELIDLILGDENE